MKILGPVRLLSNTLLINHDAAKLFKGSNEYLYVYIYFKQFVLSVFFSFMCIHFSIKRHNFFILVDVLMESFLYAHSWFQYLRKTIL